MAKRRKAEYHPIYRIDMHACMQWCLANGIKIYPIPDTHGEYTIEINNNGTIIRSPKKYKKVESFSKIWELYCHYFDYSN